MTEAYPVESPHTEAEGIFSGESPYSPLKAYPVESPHTPHGQKSSGTLPACGM